MNACPFAFIVGLFAAALWPGLSLRAAGEAPASQPVLTLYSLKTAESRVVRSPATPGTETELQVVRQWQGNYCKSTLINTGSEPVNVSEVVVLSIPHALPPSTAIWGEGFQMLSQTGGTLADPVDIGFLTDLAHYRIPQPQGATTIYGVLTLRPPGELHCVLAFTSCRRFSGSFRLWPGRIDAVMDLEGLQIKPGESWPLEELMFADGPDRYALLAALADRVAVHHPPLRFKDVPTGWCSWYCFGENVTARQLEANLEVIPKKAKGLRYFQIDDGYQAAMGDWLTVREGFGGNLTDICRRCKAAGLEPAIWVAPFIAEENSRVFREHPDWFVQDEQGKPLRSDRVTYGGWRRGPWYVLDGTHPAVGKHLENLFRVLNLEWGCTYFKLDANYWGAMHGGRHHDPNATRVEAYRRGMEAILRGAGNGFILGCNHPMWPSLGLLHGARCSMDVGGDFNHVRKTTREAFARNWEHGRFWLNDPDVLMLRGDHSLEYLRMQAAIVYATGGLILSGDDLAALPDDRLAILRKLLPPTGVAARFDDAYTVGTIDLPAGRVLVLFNWTSEGKQRVVGLPYPCRIRDFWSDEDLGVHKNEYRLDMPPQSSRLLICTPTVEIPPASTQPTTK